MWCFIILPYKENSPVSQSETFYTKLTDRQQIVSKTGRCFAQI